jgi:predicted N-acetyltransferase YhbS
VHEFGVCRPAEFPALVAALDEEFITGRGRTVSLVRRFPHALSLTRANALYVLREHQRVVASLLVRRFEWRCETQTWKGAMLGMVHTHPNARGRGLGSRLLTSTIDALTGEEVDFAVLWSGLRGFYEKLGWIPHDNGVFGEVREATKRGGAIVDSGQPTGEVVREPLAWHGIPLPATRSRRLEGADAYLLCGEAESARYVYELGGDPRGWLALWSRIPDDRKCYVNTERGSLTHHWLSQQSTIEWEQQSLTFWRMLSPRAKAAPFQRWYIPYFDRI